MICALQPARGYAVSHSDLPEFMALPSEYRELVRRHLAAFALMETAGTLKEGARLAAAELAHWGRGYSAKALADKHREWVKSHQNWRVLVPSYSNGDQRLGLPPEAFQEFVVFWIEYATRTVRHTDGLRATVQVLLRQWVYEGLRLPGFGTYAEWHRATTGRLPLLSPLLNHMRLPRGLTYATLRRLLKVHARKHDRLTHQLGYHAAHGSDPDQLLRDTSSLRFMELIAFDDLRGDHQVLAPDASGKLQVCYPLNLVAFDVATRCDLACGTKPRLTRDDDSTLGIARDDLRFLICQMFERWGLPDHKVTLLVENAAAAISTADESAMLEAFAGRVAIERTGIYDRTIGGWRESGGMPWQKGWLESMFRLLQTTLAASMPEGATGRRYDLNPGRLAIQVSHTKKLLSAASDTASTRLPLLHLDAYQQRLEAALTILRCRTDHQLQGFATVTEVVTDDGSVLALEEANQLLADGSDLQITEARERPEAPIERLARLAAATPPQRLHPSTYAHLYRQKRELTVTNGKLVWRLPKADDLIFRDPDSPLLSRAHEGKSFLCYLSEDRETLHVTSEGAYLGSLTRQARIAVQDQRALAAEAGRIHRARESDALTALPSGSGLLDRSRLSAPAPVPSLEGRMSDAEAVQKARKPSAKLARKLATAPSEDARRYTTAPISPSSADLSDLTRYLRT